MRRHGGGPTVIFFLAGHLCDTPPPAASRPVRALNSDIGRLDTRRRCSDGGDRCLVFREDGGSCSTACKFPIGCTIGLDPGLARSSAALTVALGHSAFRGIPEPPPLRAS